MAQTQPKPKDKKAPSNSLGDRLAATPAEDGAAAKTPDNVRSLAAGEFIFEEGEIGNFAYVVVSGEVEICKLSGTEYVILQNVEEGALFGEMALIDKSPRSASARAKTDAVVREIDEKALMAYIRKAPDVALNMMHRLANYVRVSNKSLESSVFEDDVQNGDNHAAAKMAPGGQPHGWSLHWMTDTDHIINEYQSPEVALEKRKPPPVVLISLLSVVTLVLAFVVWASLSIIDTTISARGRLTTTVPTISVQATDNSVVKTISVSVGSHVKKDDVLITLDETYAKSNMARARIEFNLLEARIQRLGAEMNKEGLEAVDKVSNPIQQKIFINRRKEYTSKIAAFNFDIKSLEQKLKTVIGDVELAEEQFSIQKKIEAARRQLYERDIGSFLNMLTARDVRLTSERAFRSIKNSISNLRSDIEAVKATKQAFISEWFSGIGVDLSQATKERDAKTEELVKLRRRQKNVRILAPADGVILELNDLFVGAIVNEGKTVMSLVPSNVPLTVEMDIDPRDIGNLISGAHVSIKLDALPYQKHGEILGEITFISEDTVDKSLDGQPGTFYRARSSILSNELRDLPDKFRLVPGMLLNGDIRAGRRRLITYFIYPVIRTIDTSFSEPGK